MVLWRETLGTTKRGRGRGKAQRRHQKKDKQSFEFGKKRSMQAKEKMVSAA